MKKKVSVAELEFGVFVAELDRPWTETPFMFQGFVLKDDKQLAVLKEYCKTVFIDSEKGLDLPDRKLQSGPLGSAKLTSVLASIKNKARYEEEASVDEELPRARAAQSKTEVVLKDVFGMVKAGKAIDAPRVKEAVSNMTDSVVRNPDAMLLLA